MKQDRPPWLEKKFIEPSALEDWAKGVRKAKKTIATLNGSFDLLHAGHLHILYQGALQADLLLVALNSDRSIRQYKSSNRPIVPLEYRLEMMAALEFVSYVTWFDETDPRALLMKIKPDVHVNGTEYGADCIEADLIRAQGGRLHLVDRIGTLATTALLEKIRSCV